jgi:primosomal protein N'
MIYAIVSSIVSLSEAKEFIKSREFKIKKINTHTKIDFFSNAFIKACLQVSKYYIRPFGEVLSEYIPKRVLEDIDAHVAYTEKKVLPTTQRSTPKTIYIQKQFSDRITYIRTLQTQYAHICIIVPTDAYKKYIRSNLENAEHITILTPIDIYILDEKVFDLCILEYAGSEYYRHIRKGFDSRYMVRTYCSLRNLQLIEMDSILPVYANVHTSDVVSEHIHSTPEIHLVNQKISKIAKVPKQKSKRVDRPLDDVDMKHFMENTVDVITHKKLKRISAELYSLIVYAEKQKEDVFLYTVRKGVSSSVVCSDCGHVLTCDICKKPFTLKNKDNSLQYTCALGHTPISIDSTCPVCGSIHIQGLGSGTDALVEELRHTTSMPIVVIDSDHMTQAGVRNTYKKRKDKAHKPTLYIGTELALHQGVGEKFTYGGIVSLETFFALPSSIAEFEAVRTIESMRDAITNTLVIQTRTPEHLIWKCLEQKTWNPLREEIQAVSKELHMPPYTTHIQIYMSRQYKKSDVDIEAITQYLTGYTELHPIHIQDETRHVIHIYLPNWLQSNISESLHRYLKSLPSYVRIEVDSPTLM